MNFFKTFPERSLTSTVSENAIKIISHHSRLRDVMGQSYSIYACTRANHTRYHHARFKENEHLFRYRA